MSERPKNGEAVRTSTPLDSAQVERIIRGEELMDRIASAVKGLIDALDDYEAVFPEVDELTAYYESNLWKKDYADDEAGLLPKELKRGVLSQDGVYDLLDEILALRERMGALSRPDKKDAPEPDCVDQLCGPLFPEC